MPPPKGTFNFLEGPGDYTVTKDVHNDTYSFINPRQFNLHGKVVLIVGASRGVGKETAVSFAKAGASIVLFARSNLAETEQAIKAVKDVPVLALKVDITDAKSVDAAVAEIEKQFGRLDIVVNVAGILGKLAPISESDPDAWWNVWIVNVRGLFLATRASLPLLQKSNGLKTILNVSSVGAHLKTVGGSAYQMGKLALLRFSEFIQTENEGVIAITIHPGNILNDIVGDLTEELKPLFTETNALPADTIVWLTAQRREWLNGRYVTVCWDMEQLEAKKDAIEKGDRLKVKLDVDF